MDDDGLEHGGPGLAHTSLYPARLHLSNLPSRGGLLWYAAAHGWTTRAAAPAIAAFTGATMSLPANAAPSGTMSLPRILGLADKNHPNVLGAPGALSSRCARSSTRRTSRRSAQFKLTGGVTLAPNIRGNNIFGPSTDASLTSNLRVALAHRPSTASCRSGPFGKITNLWDAAAAANVRVHEAGVEKERDGVRLRRPQGVLRLRFARDASTSSPT